jgi:hypothetical protein
MYQTMVYTMNDKITKDILIPLAWCVERTLHVSVEAELTRLLMDGGLSRSLVQGAALPRLSTRGIQVTSNNPTQLGQKIAQSVYGDIGHE